MNRLYTELSTENYEIVNEIYGNSVEIVNEISDHSIEIVNELAPYRIKSNRVTITMPIIDYFANFNVKK